MYIAAHCRASSPPLPWTPWLDSWSCCSATAVAVAVLLLPENGAVVAREPPLKSLLFCCRRNPCLLGWSFRWRSLQPVPSISYSPTRQFKTFTVMMVDMGSVSRSTDSLVDMMPEKDDDGQFASGGWNSEDGRLSCGYSSFRGKKVSMEDFYDIKTLKIGGHSVCLLGVFDGHGGFRGAEYLKVHLFDNLMKHPKSFTDAKLAISETTIISKAGKAIALFEDHEPNRSDERKRN
ncbi:hypothetical protein AHAS_Ahas20G0212600 [Arachis hypogaea]